MCFVCERAKLLSGSHRLGPNKTKWAGGLLYFKFKEEAMNNLIVEKNHSIAPEMEQFHFCGGF